MRWQKKEPRMSNIKLVGLHKDVYAEDEADSFKEERPKEIKGGTIETEDQDDLPKAKFVHLNGKRNGLRV